MTMRVTACVKYVPDAGAGARFAADLTVDRDAVSGLLSELDEYAVEQALRIAEQTPDADVTVLTVGPPGARDALRKALSMGAARAVHIEDSALHGTDVLGTSLVLAAALQRIGYDLIVCGMASTDGGMGVLPALLAERLGIPQLTLLTEVSVRDSMVRGRRDGDTASEQLEAALPAVVSVTDRSGEARYPSFKGIMAAKKAPVTSWALSDLGIQADAVGLAGARTRVGSVASRPARAAGTIVTDTGEGGRQLAGFLATRKLI